MAERLFELGAQRLGDLIRSGDIGAAEAVAAALARIEQVNPALNAVVVSRAGAAREEALAIDRRRARGEVLPPLAGVPVTVKESLDLEGTPSTFGLPWRAREIAPADALHVRRLREAGAIVVGKTNVSQLLMYVESDNPVYGRTLNPWNAERTCGGSSGGEGAIIAAGGSPLGLGSDVGGSSRYPAAFCGIASLKPTAGRCDDAGRFSVPFGQRAIVSQVGVLARHVDDVELGLRTIDGPAPDAFQPPPSLEDSRNVDVSTLRVGYYVEDGVMPSSAAVRRAVLEAAALLKANGAAVFEWSPPGIPDAYALAFALLAADGGDGMRATLRGGATHPTIQSLLLLTGRSRPTLKAMAALLRALGQPTLAEFAGFFGRRSTADYWAACERQIELRRQFVAAMDGCAEGPVDVVLGPACALPAFRHGTTRDLVLGGANAILYNVLGFPAGIVAVTKVRPDEENGRPASRDIVARAARRCDEGSAGLPIGVQLAARPWREHVVLAAMRAIETAARKRADFPDRPPL